MLTSPAATPPPFVVVEVVQDVEVGVLGQLVDDETTVALGERRSKSGGSAAARWQSRIPRGSGKRAARAANLIDRRLAMRRYYCIAATLLRVTNARGTAELAVTFVGISIVRGVDERWAGGLQSELCRASGSAFAVSAGLGCDQQERSPTPRPRDGTARMADTLAVIYTRRSPTQRESFLNRERADAVIDCRTTDRLPAGTAGTGSRMSASGRPDA